MFRRWIVAVLLCLAIVSTFAYDRVFQFKEAIDKAAAMPEHFETVETFTVQAKRYTAIVKALGVAIAMPGMSISSTCSMRNAACSTQPNACFEQRVTI